MATNKANPFDECPVYETKHFLFRLVQESDAADLFICYSDPITLKHMNNDNCPGDWKPTSVDDMKDLWRRDYELRRFIRWSIIHKRTRKVVGTIEIAPVPWGKWFFGPEPPIGILRLDLLSSFENQEFFSEIICMMATELADDFAVSKVIMKGPADEPERVNALVLNHFYPDTDNEFQYDDYYVR